jgi:hypothetical protein
MFSGLPLPELLDAHRFYFISALVSMTTMKRTVDFDFLGITQLITESNAVTLKADYFEAGILALVACAISSKASSTKLT